MAVCVMCGRSLGLLDKRTEIINGVVCFNCLEKAGFSVDLPGYNISFGDKMDLMKMNTSQIIEAGENEKKMKPLVARFEETGRVSNAFRYNDNSKQLLVADKDGDIRPHNFIQISYDQIVAFELLENGNVSSMDAIDGAIVGGFLFGGAGAIAGSNIMGSSKKCTQLQIKLTLRNYSKPAFYITLIDNVNAITVGSDQYNQKTMLAQDMLSKLHLIMDEMKRAEAKSYNEQRLDNNLQIQRSYEQNKLETGGRFNAPGSININPNNIEPTITRIELFLEDNDWDKVVGYANAALDYFPTDYRLYLFLLLAEFKASTFDELKEKAIKLEDNGNFKKALRFADSDAARQLESCLSVAKDNEKLDAQYTEAIQLMDNKKYDEAQLAFAEIGPYKDSENKRQECLLKKYEHQKANELIENKRKIRDKKNQALSEALEQRKTLIRMLERSGNANKDITNRVEAIEVQLLKHAGIDRNADNTYSFKNYKAEIKSNTGTPWFVGSNEWLLIGRTEDKLLFLSKYLVRTYDIFSKKPDCEWINSNIYRLLNSSYTESGIAFTPLLYGFSINHQKLIGRIGLLSSQEVEKYLPNRADRILTEKSNSGKTFEWFLKDGVKSSMVTLVNRSGEIARLANSSLLSAYHAATRPAIWIDVDKLYPVAKAEETISIGDPEYEYIEHEGYSLFVPKYIAETIEPIPKDGGIMVHNADNDLITIGVNESEIVSSQNVHPSLIGADETIELETGSVHIFGFINTQKHIGGIQAFFKSTGDEVGLNANGLYVLKDNYTQKYNDLRKGFLNICKNISLDRIDPVDPKLIDLQLTTGIKEPEYEYLTQDTTNYPLTPDASEKNGDSVNSSEECSLSDIVIQGDEVTLKDFNGIDEWIVLKKNGDNWLLISKYMQEYREVQKYIPYDWESSAIRDYLNTEFIKKFSDNQRSKLQIPSDCGTIGVNDKVFLMSEDEYKTIFWSREDDRRYMRRKVDNLPEIWALRSKDKKGKIQFVTKDGYINSKDGNSLIAGVSMFGIRPLIWINVSDEISM